MSRIGNTTASIPEENRKQVMRKLVEPKASSSLHENKVSVNSTRSRSPVPTIRDASQSLTQLTSKAPSKNPRIEPKTSESHKAPGIEYHSDWTACTKKGLEKNKKDIDLIEEDKLALMALDHFLEGLKSHIVPSERNWFLDFEYTNRGAPYIKISTKCGCGHEMAAEHFWNGEHLKKGKLVLYSLAEVARWIRKNWVYDDCENDTDGVDKANSERTPKARRTAAL